MWSDTNLQGSAPVPSQGNYRVNLSPVLGNCPSLKPEFKAYRSSNKIQNKPEPIDSTNMYTSFSLLHLS